MPYVQAFILLHFALLGNGPFWSQLDDDPELATAVTKLESLRAGKQTNFEHVEEVASNLLTGFSDPRRRGIILFHLANVYVQSGMQHRDTLIEHAEASLAVLADGPRRAALHTFLGDAWRLGIGGPPNKDSRRTAAAWYARGLSEITKVAIPSQLPPREFMIVSDTGDEEADLKQEAEQLKRNQEREHIRMVQLHRAVLEKQLVSLYVDHPAERDELETVCTTYLPDAMRASILEQIPDVPADALTARAAGATRFRFILYGNIVALLLFGIISLAIRLRRSKQSA